jgi:hypothetical protein
MLRLVQLQNRENRRVAIVEEPRLRLIGGFDSIFAMATVAIDRAIGLSALVGQHGTDQTLDYDEIYLGKSQWRLMVPLDHPEGPARTLVSGTGLTHLGSARDRQAMHKKGADAEQNLTDSMKMFHWGVEGGRPAPGQIGVAPEWFYKGNGSILRAPGEPLDVPAYAEDGGEEAEIVGLYVVGPDGTPRRVGMAVGNEFSDHQFEKRNYLNLAGSKIRTCSIGPEIVIDPVFESVAGEARIQRGDQIVWAKPIRSGQAEMCHSLANIEHHHFKFEAHRRPGDVHVHYFGAHCLSFGDGVRLADGDMMVIRFDEFGRELRNPVRVVPSAAANLVSVISLA